MRSGYEPPSQSREINFYIQLGKRMHADQDRTVFALKRARKADGQIGRLFVLTPEIFIAQQASSVSGFSEHFTPQRAHPQVGAADIVYLHIAGFERRPNRYFIAAPVHSERKRKADGFNQRERTPSIAVKQRRRVFDVRREKSLLLFVGEFAHQLRLPRHFHHPVFGVRRLRLVRSEEESRHCQIDQMRLTAVKEIERQQTVIRYHLEARLAVAVRAHGPHPAAVAVNARGANPAMHLGQRTDGNVFRDRHRCLTSVSGASDRRYSATMRRWHLSAFGSAQSRQIESFFSNSRASASGRRSASN